MRKLENYLYNSLKFFACALFWLDDEDFEPTILGFIMCILAPIAIPLCCIVSFARYIVYAFKRLN